MKSFIYLILGLCFALGLYLLAQFDRSLSLEKASLKRESADQRILVPSHQTLHYLSKSYWFYPSNA